MYKRDWAIIAAMMVAGVWFAAYANDRPEPPKAPPQPSYQRPQLDPDEVAETGTEGHYQLIGAAGGHGPLLVSTVSGRAWELNAETRKWSLIERPEEAVTAASGIAAILAMADDVKPSSDAANTPSTDGSPDAPAPRP